MFGYILPNLESLDDEEKARYRSVYCGVCRSLKARYGQMSRIGVSYDMAFLALLLGSLYEPEEACGQARCPVHPLAPQRYVRTPFTDYAADLSVALVYHKCLDDWRDDASKRARGVSLALSGAYRTAARLRGADTEPPRSSQVEATAPQNPPARSLPETELFETESPALSPQASPAYACDMKLRHEEFGSNVFLSNFTSYCGNMPLHTSGLFC